MLRLIFATDILRQEASEELVFSHSALYECLVAYKLFVDLRDDKRQADDPDFCENVLQDSDWKYVVIMLIQFLKSSGKMDEALCRIIHYLMSTDFKFTIAAINNYEIDLPVNSRAEVDEKTTDIILSKDWKNMVAAYTWIGEKKFENLIRDTELPTFWKQVVRFKLQEKIFDQYELLDDSILPFVRNFMEGRQFEERERRILDLSLSPFDLQIGLALLDGIDWFKTFKPSFDALPREVYKSLQGINVEQTDVLAKFENNFSLETGKWLYDTLIKCSNWRANEKLFSKMIIQLGRIIYANSGWEDLEKMVVDLGEILYEITSEQDISSGLLEACCISWFMSDQDRNAATPYARKRLLLDFEPDQPIPQEPKVGPNDLKKSPAAAVLFSERGADWDDCHAMLDILEEYTEALARSTNWEYSSPEVQMQLLKDVLVYGVDPRWMMFKGVNIPLCWVVGLGGWIWLHLLYSGMIEEEENSEARIAQRLTSWIEWLSSTCKPLQILVGRALGNWCNTEQYPRLEEIVEDAFIGLRSQSKDPDISFYIRFPDEYS